MDEHLSPPTHLCPPRMSHPHDAVPLPGYGAAVRELIARRTQCGWASAGDGDGRGAGAGLPGRA